MNSPQISAALSPTSRSGKRALLSSTKSMRQQFQPGSTRSSSLVATIDPMFYWKLALVIQTMINVVLFSGVIYGFSQIEIILKDRGVFQKPDDQFDVLRYNTIITVASAITAGSGLFIGIALDASGPRLMMVLASIATAVGCIVFGYLRSYLAGYCLFALAGMTTLISSFRVGFVFPERLTLLMGLVSCLFDTSSVVFAVFLQLYNAGVTVEQLFIAYGIIALLCGVSTFTLWTINGSEHGKDSTPDGEGDGTSALLLSPAKSGVGGSRSISSHDEGQGQGQGQGQGLVLEESSPLRTTATGMRTSAGYGSIGASIDLGHRAVDMDEDEDKNASPILRVDGLVSVLEDADLGLLPESVYEARAKGERLGSGSRMAGGEQQEEAEQEEAEQEEEGLKGLSVRQRAIRGMTLWEQMVTPEFWFIYVFCVVLMLRSNLFLGMVQDMLATLGDADHGDAISIATGWIVPAGVLFVPIIDWALASGGYGFSAYSVVGIGIAYGALSCVHQLQLQSATAVLFTLYRAFLFSVVAAFNADVFGPMTVGRISGILYTTTAAFIGLQPLLTRVAQGPLDGDYMPVNAGLTVLAACLLPIVWWISSVSPTIMTRKTGEPQDGDEDEDDEADEDKDRGEHPYDLERGTGTLISTTHGSGRADGVQIQAGHGNGKTMGAHAHAKRLFDSPERKA